MRTKRTHFTAHLKQFGRELDFYFRQSQIDEFDRIKTHFATNMTMELVDEGKELPRPTFSLSMEEAQELMDNLYQCGLRPTEAAGSAGQLAAVQAHLEDMRKIAYLLIQPAQPAQEVVYGMEKKG